MSTAANTANDEAPKSRVGRKKTRGTDNAVTVAAYLTRQIELCEKTHKTIAAEAGFSNPNIISILKAGGTKVPINRAPALARSIGVDPIYFMSLVMGEYAPDTWNAIQEVFGKHVVSSAEIAILNTIREAANGLEVQPVTGSEKAELTELVKKWVAREESDYQVIKNAR